jgi:hypothetical protein
MSAILKRFLEGWAEMLEIADSTCNRGNCPARLVSKPSLEKVAALIPFSKSVVLKCIPIVVTPF